MSGGPRVNGAHRIPLARRASGCDHAVVFEPDAFRVEGGFALRRRIAYRRVHGLERAGAWLLVGAGLVPIGVGGRDVAPAQLDAVAAELRARIGALPDGVRRLARLDARRTPPRRMPAWSALLAAGLAAALAPAGARAVLPVLWLLALGVPAERWLGPAALLACGTAGALAAALTAGPAALVSPAGLAAQALPAAWAGLLLFARLRREAGLSVVARSALESALVVACGFGVFALASSAPPLPLAAAALAGFSLAAGVLRRAAP